MRRADNPPPPRSRRKISRISVGAVTVKIYHGTNKVAGREYPQHTVVFRDLDGRRVRRRFNDLRQAKDDAEQIAMRLARGEAAVVSLTDQERAYYLQAVELLRPFNKPLNLAIGEYVDALRALPEGLNLVEAVRAHVERTRHLREVRRIPDLVREFITAKEKAGVSERHLADIRSRLHHFSHDFQVAADALTGPLLQAYLDRMGVSSRTRLNHWRHIVTMLRWCVRRKLAPRELLDEGQAVDRPRPESRPIGILKPEEFADLLEGSRRFHPSLLGWIVLGGFCGLRTAELQRLEWSMVKIDRGFVEVPAVRAKTRQRRLSRSAKPPWSGCPSRHLGRAAYRPTAKKTKSSRDWSRRRTGCGNNARIAGCRNQES